MPKNAPIVLALSILLLPPVYSSLGARDDGRSEPCAPLDCDPQVVLPGEACPRCALACTSDEDCSWTDKRRPVSEVDECYCPHCPVVIASAIRLQVEASWEEHCSGAWAADAGCALPVCPRPLGKPECREHRCQIRVAEP